MYESYGIWEKRLKRIEEYGCPYLGLAEMCFVLGERASTVYNRLTRTPDKLPPFVQLAMGPVWSKDVVKKWIKNNC